MYVVRHVRGEDGWSTQHLYEMTKHDLAYRQQEPGSVAYSVEWRKVSTAEAHRYVKSGGVHSTALWVDDNGRVRKATAGY